MKECRAIRKICRMLALSLAVLSLTACTAEQERFTLRDEGVELFQKGDYEGALTKFEAAMEASKGEVSPLQYDILKYSTECRLRLGDYEGARTGYEALMQLDDERTDQEQYQGLLEELDGLRVMQDVRTLIEEGEYEAALEMLEPYAKLDGSVTGKAAWYDRAVCEEYLQHYEKAADLFNQYLKMYPDDNAADKEYRFCSSR